MMWTSMFSSARKRTVTCASNPVPGGLPQGVQKVQDSSRSTAALFVRTHDRLRQKSRRPAFCFPGSRQWRHILAQAYGRKRVDDLFGSLFFFEVSNDRIEADTSACDPKGAIFLVDVGRYWKR